jgi:hypothetical protein
MATTRSDYTADAVAGARSVLLELARLLGEYRDSIVLVGGWVPEMLLPQAPLRHVGSMDIDLAVDHTTLQDPRYETIHRLLLNRGYYPSQRQPFIFYRTARVHDHAFTVQVDLLAGEYAGTGPARRTQAVQDIRARKARGCDLVFEMATQITLHGELPDGGQDSAVMKVADIVPFLVMKGMALHDRLKEKDAWDIYYCLRNYPGGVDALAAEFRPHLGLHLVNEGLLKIRGKFISPGDWGPTAVAAFEELSDAEERAIRQRDAYERVNYLLERLELG